MPSKTEFYRQMADHVATQLTGSWQEWAGFLTTAARLYKYPFHEQLLIYAQRPDATACAEYDLWSSALGRITQRPSLRSPCRRDRQNRPDRQRLHRKSPQPSTKKTLTIRLQGLIVTERKHRPPCPATKRRSMPP